MSCTLGCTPCVWVAPHCVCCTPLCLPPASPTCRTSKYAPTPSTVHVHPSRHCQHNPCLHPLRKIGAQTCATAPNWRARILPTSCGNAFDFFLCRHSCAQKIWMLVFPPPPLLRKETPPSTNPGRNPPETLRSPKTTGLKGRGGKEGKGRGGSSTRTL